MPLRRPHLGLKDVISIHVQIWSLQNKKELRRPSLHILVKARVRGARSSPEWGSMPRLIESPWTRSLWCWFTRQDKVITVEQITVTCSDRVDSTTVRQAVDCLLFLSGVSWAFVQSLVSLTVNNKEIVIWEMGLDGTSPKSTSVRDCEATLMIRSHLTVNCWRGSIFLGKSVASILMLQIIRGAVYRIVARTVTRQIFVKTHPYRLL